MKFHTTEKQLQDQIDLATRKASPSEGWMTVVTISKVTPSSRLSFYGFHFEKTGSVSEGDIQHLEDGSVRRIEAIIR